MKKYKVLISVVFYSVMFYILHYYHEEMFSEINRLIGSWKQSQYSSLLSPDRLTNAFHLRDDLRTKNSNVILIWTPMFGQVQSIGEVEDGCVRTYDRSAIDVATAVVFHFAEISDDASKLPIGKRKEWQRWIWWCMEPPWNTRFVFGKSLASMTNIFNLTMTYRLDSDILYSYTAGLPSQDNRTVKEMIEQKTAPELGIALVSNCWSDGRQKILEELQQHIHIDVRGKCTNNPLCRGDCAMQTIRRYKFFFAFENSLCKDYITEKFLQQGLHGGAVPVVMGPPRSTYEKFAPANSFIHVDDFDTVRELADYLLLLDVDNKKYGNYLKWRTMPDNIRKTSFKIFSNPWKHLCDLIKKSPSKISTVPNLENWWYGEGYEKESSRFPVCSPDSGPSGLALSKYLLIFNIAVVSILCIITVKFCL